MPAGRPTLYRPEYVQQLLDFFGEGSAFETVTDDRGKQSIVPLKLPTFERFASNVGVSKQCLYEWAEKHEEFGDAFTRCRQMQADMLMQGGLFGSYEKTIAKMLLSANHGIIEKTSQEVTGADGKDLVPAATDNELARRVAIILAQGLQQK